jgi:hypothetical protein
MRIITLMIILCFYSVLSWGETKSNITKKIQLKTSSIHSLFKGKLIEISVEKAIFHSVTNNNFLIKFTIKNVSNKVIGIDLTNYWKVIYPNSWGLHKKPYRMLIDERRIKPEKINKSELIKKFNENSLTMIKPNKSIEYFRDWNGSGEKIELKDNKTYLIISIDGQLLSTDGKIIENATLADSNEAKRDVVFSYPLKNKNIPSKSLIVKHK